jgi:uncharacterized secreted protein with C-terminal beta-propeller domain
MCGGSLMANLRKVVFGIVLSLLVISGCGDGVSNLGSSSSKGEQAVPLNALKLQQPDNCDDLKNYIVTSIVEQFTAIPRHLYYYCPISAGGENQSPPPSGTPDTVVNSPGSGAGGSNADQAPDDVSDTNNQEQGVNEADMVKADDSGVVYILSGRHLVIAKGFPPQELTTLKQVNLGAHGTQLFLDKAEQRLVVLARYDTPIYIAEPVDNVDAGADVAIYPPIQDWDVTVAIFYDVSTPENPTMLDQIRLKGYFQDGRRIDDRIHLVLRNYYYPQVFYQDQEMWQLRQAYWQAVHSVQCENPDADPDVVTSNPAVVAAKAAFAERVNTLFNSIIIKDYLPTAHRQTTGGVLQPIPFLACSDIQHPEVSASLGLQVLASMDTDGQNIAATAVVNNAWQTYASKDNLYVAETSRNWWTLQDSSLPTSQTAIYKFAISKNKPEYVATGAVRGYTHNQFSFSEYDGVLRVATTEDDVFYDITPDGKVIQTWERKNNLFVLADDGKGNLTTSGAVRGFGKDETIRSSRFMGERGFVVTFQQIDPLFTFDLSDPANPQLAGKVDIPGFSSYMHPYDDNHIITIGRAGGAGGIGVGNGIQLQLFDVSDLSKPERLHEFTPQTSGGWSWSAAEYDHKAFTFYKPANLLAIPMQFTPDTGALFSGIVAYDVSPEAGFKELGQVDHSDMAYEYYCNSGVVLYPDYQPDCDNGWYIYWAAPRRSVVMTSGQNTYLYTVSDVGMKASDVADLGVPLGAILFPPQPYPWWYVIADKASTEVPPETGVPADSGNAVVF